MSNLWLTTTYNATFTTEGVGTIIQDQRTWCRFLNCLGKNFDCQNAWLHISWYRSSNPSFIHNQYVGNWQLWHSYSFKKKRKLASSKAYTSKNSSRYSKSFKTWSAGIPLKDTHDIIKLVYEQNSATWNNNKASGMGADVNQVHCKRQMTSRYCTKAVGRGLEHRIVTSSTSSSPIQEITDTSKRFTEPEKKKPKTIKIRKG